MYDAVPWGSRSAHWGLALRYPGTKGMAYTLNRTSLKVIMMMALSASEKIQKYNLEMIAAKV